MLGGVESLACHPKTTTLGLSAAEMEKAQIGDGLVRISVGIGDWRSVADFEQAIGEDREQASARLPLGRAQKQ